MKPPIQREVQKQLNTFTDHINSLVLSTVNKKGEPFASYAPFVEDDRHNYYVCVSGFVEHSKNMASTKKASILFIEDEGKTENIFARRRVYFSVIASKFEADENEKVIKELFVKKFGKMAEFLLQMPDFRIYKLNPQEGSAVFGFGAAYKIDKNKNILSQKNASHETTHENNIR